MYEATGSGHVEGGSSAQGRVREDAAPFPESCFARLIPAIERLVALVDGHQPDVRRRAFDAYVTALVDDGADVDDLAPLDRPAEPARANPAKDLPRHRTLPGLARLAPPTNNDERNVVIAAWLHGQGQEATHRAIVEGYERAGWRLPVNMGASLRQTVRKGLLAVDEQGRLYVTEAGSAHFG